MTPVSVPFANSVWEEEAEGKQLSSGIEGTHGNNMTNLVEIQPPASDRLVVLLRMETARNWVPFALLDNVLLDCGHSPAI